MTPDETLAQDFGALPALLRLRAQQHPQATALVCGEARMTWGELDAQMDRVASALQRDGLMPGDAIAICATASIGYALVFLGALRAGVAVAPLSPAAAPEALWAMLDDCAARRLFCDAAVETALAALGDASLPARLRLDAPSFEDWLAPRGSAPRPVEVRPDDVFNLIYSSGTTGTPKGIVQSHRMRWLHARRALALALGYDAAAVTLLSTPLYSNTTLVAFFPALAGGGCVVLMPKFDALGFLQLAERERVTHAMLVPVQYQRIMAVPDFARFDLSRFRLKLSTSAPFAAAL